VTAASRQRYGISVARGALISSVRSGSPADRAGLPLGGVIVSVNGNRIDAPSDLSAAVSRLRTGDRVEVTYYQGDRMRRKTVEVGAPRNSGPQALPRLAENPRQEPALGVGRGLADRPLLGRLGQALGGFIQPPEGGAAPPAPSNDVDRLRQEVDSLRRHIGRLEQRLETLEKKLDES
jgi:serine protease Do